MVSHYAKSILVILGMASLVACSPSKKEATETQPEDLTSGEKQSLSIDKQEKLALAEDDIMNPYPG